MKKKKLLRIAVILMISGALIGGGTAIYIFNVPHRNVVGSEADYSLSNTEIVSEYLINRQSADEKYLSSDGNSKILEVTGTVSKISENFNSEKVVLLKEDNDMAGVSVTFTAETNHKLSGIQLGETIKVKGVIRSGASYDKDLGFYENVILEKSDLLSH